MKLIKQIVLYYKKDQSDKVYEIDLCEVGQNKYVVNIRYGKRGTSLKDGTKTILPVSLNQAEQIYEKLRLSKMEKGYKLSLTDFAKATDDSITNDAYNDAYNEVDVPQVDDKRKERILHKIDELFKICYEYFPTPANANERIFKTNLRLLGRAIWRAGELKIVEAEELLITCLKLKNPLLNYTTVWALGNCYDNKNIAKDSVFDALMKIYSDLNTEDMVKRITLEAMFKILDPTQKAEFVNNLIQSLPDELKTVIDTTPEIFLNKLEEYLKKASYKEYGVLYALYQIDNDVVRPALIELLRKVPMRPNYFKQIRYIFKAAEYRHDAEVFGIIAYRFEKNRAMFERSYYGRAYINGKYLRKPAIIQHLKMPNAKAAYSNHTRTYFKDRVWRTLRRMGEMDAIDYVKMAIGILLQFTDDKDAGKTRSRSITKWHRPLPNATNRRWTKEVITTHYDTFAMYKAFNQILYRNSPRYTPRKKSWVCKASYQPGNPQPTLREEAFPQLWDKLHRQVIGLLSESKCKRVQQFGVKVLRDCEEFMSSPKVEDVKMLLSSPYIETATFGFELFDKVYDPANPSIELLTELLTCLANCCYEPARKKAFELISFKKDYLVNNNEFLLLMITSDYSDVRKFIGSMLEMSLLNEANANALLGRLISYLMLIGSDKKNSIDTTKITDISNILLKALSTQCSTLGLDIIMDFMRHPIEQIQEIGAKIILNHETYSKNPPEDIIQLLINSKFNSIRGLGVKLFGQLPDDLLMSKLATLLVLVMHDIAEMREAIRPVIKRLALSNGAFGEEITTMIIKRMFKIRNEDKQQFITTLIKEDLVQTSYLPMSVIWKLLNSSETAYQEIGGLFLDKSNDLYTLNVEQIVKLASCDVLFVRNISRRLCESNIAMLKQDMDSTIRLLDAEWDDSKDFAFDFIRKNFTKEDFTPKSLVSICDSTKGDIQQFGRELIMRFFEDKHGEEYLLKLSEHPSSNVGLFVTNYLERYACDNPKRLSELTNYFKRALCQVNKGKAVKERIFAFLEEEASKSHNASDVIAEILTFVSATISITYKAKAIRIMVKINQKYPDIKLPIRIKELEERNNVI